MDLPREAIGQGVQLLMDGGRGGGGRGGSVQKI